MNLGIPLLFFDVQKMDTLPQLQEYSERVIKAKIEKDHKFMPVLFGRSGTKDLVIADFTEPASMTEAPRAIYEAGVKVIKQYNLHMCVLIVDVAICEIPISHPDFEKIRSGAVSKHEAFPIERRVLVVAQRPGHHVLTLFKVEHEGLKITALGEMAPAPTEDLGDWFLLYKNAQVT